MMCGRLVDVVRGCVDEWASEGRCKRMCGRVLDVVRECVDEWWML